MPTLRRLLTSTALLAVLLFPSSARGEQITWIFEGQFDGAPGTGTSPFHGAPVTYTLAFDPVWAVEHCTFLSSCRFTNDGTGLRMTARIGDVDYAVASTAGILGYWTPTDLSDPSKGGILGITDTGSIIGPGPGSDIPFTMPPDGTFQQGVLYYPNMLTPLVYLPESDENQGQFATSGSRLRLWFSPDPSDAGGYSVAAPLTSVRRVPEPTSLALLGLAAPFAVRALRRRR